MSQSVAVEHEMQNVGLCRKDTAGIQTLKKLWKCVEGGALYLRGVI